MNNKNRVRQTPSTPAAKIQPQTIDDSIDTSGSLLLTDHGAMIARLDLTPAQVQFIQNTARKSEVSLDKILEGGLARMTRDFPDSELEMAQIEANSLLELLCDKLDHITRSGSDFSGPHAESVVAGISLMVRNAQVKLRSSFEGVFHALHAPLANGTSAAKGGAR